MINQARQRRTKIVATLGPASASEEVLKQLILAGVNVFRMNFSHGSHEAHRASYALISKIAKACQMEITTLADLQGPKIRIARFQKGPIQLASGDRFILDAALADDAGSEHVVGLDYKDLPKDVNIGDTLLLDDGRLVFFVEKVVGQKIHCLVETGGLLSNNKGINRLGGGLSAKALTEKDKTDLAFAISLPVDYIALSFPRSAQDIEEARALLRASNSHAGIIAKIERKEAIDNLDEIIRASDGVMVARGDLGVELGEAEVPGLQKFIIHQARSFDKPVITATQMMESMIQNAMPTRAEVSDVANAVLDGTDAVMLSAETATGNFPVRVVEAMSRICLAAEKNPLTQTSRHRVEKQFMQTDEAIAMATMYTANHLEGIKAIICLTESGSTPLWMSRIRSGIPIYALSRHVQTRRKVALYRGVYAIPFDLLAHERKHLNAAAVAELESRQIVSKGDLVILTKGDQVGLHGGTNAMKILRVGEVH